MINDIEIIGYVASSVPNKNHQWGAVMSPFGIMRTLMATDFIKFPAPRILVRRKNERNSPFRSSK